MKHKVFIGIELPAQVRKRIVQKLEKWADLPVRWTKMDNLHITLSFLGYMEDEALASVCQKVALVAENFEAFDIGLNSIILAPDDQSPKMFWLAGEPDEQLKELKEKLDEALGTGEGKIKSFAPHVTLGRIRAIKWAELKEKSAVDEKLSASVPVDKVIVFESKVEGGRLIYYPLETCPLK